MFKKILIANRGEIACRIIKTARRMGIGTAAVYSDADKEALHVHMADEAVHIGPSPAADSYLRIDGIVEACLKTKAEAVHPGYGFLSEKAEFVEALEAAGIVFIGPKAHAVRSMGDKIESKKLAKHAGVNTVPGHLEAIKDADEAVKIAKKVGYPVMIKASAGGGGKGMRLAWNDAETREGFASATHEAKTAFADDRVFIEKFVQQPRHIEIQILADGFGNTLYLGERECSIQRRHQKVIEEAPSSFLSAEMRKAMGEQAVALARAVRYQSAGTVEFIVSGATGEFFFLEMNTRLQVEHPVTEMITKLDLVEWMIRIAAGEELALRQQDVVLDGWAIEARIYAEDPFRNFLPSIGRLIRYSPPAETSQLRIDSGVYEGGEIGMFYDPMIAKIIACGPVRNTAIAHLREALDAYYIRGLSHNIPFLASVVGKERFVKGDLTTGFIAEEYKNGFHVKDLPASDPTVLIAVALVVKCRVVARNIQTSGQFPGHAMTVPIEWTVVLNNADYYDVECRPSVGGYAVVLNGEVIGVRTDWKIGDPLVRAVVDNKPVCVQLDRNGVYYTLAHGGAQVQASVLPRAAAAMNRLMPIKAQPDMSRYLLSPMPGLLRALDVQEGQEVKAGETLAVVEAMKMENILKAEWDCVVAKIHARPGESLSVDQKIVEFAV